MIKPEVSDRFVNENGADCCIEPLRKYDNIWCYSNARIWHCFVSQNCLFLLGKYPNVVLGIWQNGVV